MCGKTGWTTYYGVRYESKPMMGIFLDHGGCSIDKKVCIEEIFCFLSKSGLWSSENDYKKSIPDNYNRFLLHVSLDLSFTTFLLKNYQKELKNQETTSKAKKTTNQTNGKPQLAIFKTTEALI